MSSRERALDRGTRQARDSLARVGNELRSARRDRGLSIDAASVGAAISNAEWSRIERALSPRVPLVTLARCASVVGLDLVARLYPGGQPLRDHAHIALLDSFRSLLHRSCRFETEVPLPIPGDRRAWDAVVQPGPTLQSRTPRWVYGVEAETSPRDAQALDRRLQLKVRDSGFDGVLLLLPDSRTARSFVHAWRGSSEAFPVSSTRALELLGAAADPGGSAIVFLKRKGT